MEQMSTCPFCRRMSSGTVDLRHASAVALPDAFPLSPGHTLVVPTRHTASVATLSEEELADLWKLTRRCVNALTRLMKPDGFNIGINLGRVAGAGVVEHLHIHVVPRWNGDTNFMPVLAETRVIVEHLHAAWRKIRSGFAEQRAT